jgi:hypothetical protein
MFSMPAKRLTLRMPPFLATEPWDALCFLALPVLAMPDVANIAAPAANMTSDSVSRLYI